MRIEQREWTPTGWQPPFLGTGDATVQLVLVFGSPALLKSGDYQSALRQQYPNAYLLGCSTAGEIYDTRVQDESLVITAIQFEHTQVKGVALSLAEGESSITAGERLGRSLDPEGLVHVFVLSDGLQVNGSELVKGLAQALPAGVTLTGGLSGDGDRFQETLVLWNQTVAPGMIAGIGLYGDRLQVGHGSVGGWSPFGPERRITSSNGNVLYELDGQSALALYKKYLGEHASGLPATGLLFPLSLSLKSGADGEKLPCQRLVRTILSVDEAAQSLTFAGDVPEGMMAQLMHASFDHLVAGAEAAATNTQQSGVAQPDLAILISCVGRKLLLKQRIEDEIEAVREVLGPTATLTGFYSYGEIAPFDGGGACELHNQTMTITTLAEI